MEHLLCVHFILENVIWLFCQLLNRLVRGLTKELIQFLLAIVIHLLHIPIRCIFAFHDIFQFASCVLVWVWVCLSHIHLFILLVIQYRACYIKLVFFLVVQYQGDLVLILKVKRKVRQSVRLVDHGVVISSYYHAFQVL